MNSEWSDQAARRPGFAQQAAPPEDIWSENDALLPGVLDADVPFMQQFEGSSFPLRPPHQNSGPQGYRGRAAPQQYQPGYAAVNLRTSSSLTNPSDPIRNLQSPHSWGLADNQVSKQSTSRAWGGTQEDLLREFDELRRQADIHSRKLNFLHNELNKNRDEVKAKWVEMDEKWSSIDEKVMKYSNPEDLFNALEGKFERTLVKNNRSIRNWVQIAVERHAEHDRNDGTEGYNNSTWGEQMEAGDIENQDVASFDFLK